MTLEAGRLHGPPGERLFVVERAGNAASGGDAVSGGEAADDRAIVLIHGFPGNLHAWRPVMDRLPPDRRVLAVDLLGLGRSDRRPAADHGPAAHARRLLRLLDDRRIARATAVGLSYGGAVAQWLAAARPDRVDRLVLVAPVDASRPSEVARHWRLQAIALAAGLSVPAVARRVLAAGLRREAMDRGLVTREMVDGYLGPLLRPGTRRSLWAYGRDAAAAVPLDLGAIATPTVIVAGTDDGIVPIATARRIAARIPGARLIEVDGGRHLLGWDVPDRLVAAIIGR